MKEIIHLPASDEELLSLCEIQTYRSSGSGGQHVNKTDTAVRLTYKGITVTCQEERSQLLNKLRCVEKLREKVARLNYRKPKRIATKKSKSQKAKDLDRKSKKSQKKTLRKKIKLDE